ncbi:HdeD family acid-resistance protein [Paracoccus tegillarcae]|uniref:HdeD family acid-resistance protein n=1 Tax=Paracoccus tegillarcae TaxID=1529068 RepID=A0A2K9EFS4_9RHOB|nr:DUF308 domain-containing protein [Paracoccus tegillarcae]AUH33808.1 hypothetical protein CUV01_10770 [Paracoccus tegillarcae]
MGSKVLWIIIGVLSIIAGIFALANPLAATLTATLIAGWGFLIVGVLQIVAVFQAEGWGGRIWAGVLAAAFILVGIQLLGNPLEGTISLTVAVGILFMITGIARIIMSFSLQRGGGFWLVLLSGVLAVILSLMIFSNFPQSAAVMLGVMLAVELISNGVAMIVLGSTARK